ARATPRKSQAATRHTVGDSWMTASISAKSARFRRVSTVLGRLALILLHECQHTIHVTVCFAKRGNSVIAIHGAAPGIVCRDDVLQRTAAVAILLDQKAEVTSTGVDILLRNPSIGTILPGG